MAIFTYILFAILVFFVPLSFAATEPWAFLVLQISLSFILFYLLVKRHSFVFSLPSKIISAIFVFLITICCIQLFNPHSITQQFSILPFTVCSFYTLNELAILFTYFMAFIIVTQLFESYKELDKLVFIIFIAASVVMILAVCFTKGEYIKFFLGSDIFGTFGPFVNRNSAGMFLSMSFFIALSFTVNKFLGYRKYIQQNKRIEFIIRQSIQILFSIALLISVVLTRSRGAMFATFLSIFSFLLIISCYLPTVFKTRIKYIIIICVLFIISSFYIYKNMDIINAYSGRVSGDFSEQARKMLYTSALNMLEDYPLTGVGIAAFPVAINKYLPKSLDAYPEHLHNDWLELILGIGYPAGIVFIIATMMLIYIFISRIKFLRSNKKIYFIGLSAAALSLSIGSLVDFHLHIPANAFMFFIVLGLLSASSFYKDKVKYLNINLYVKIFVTIIMIYLLYFSIKNTLAWKYFVFGENLSLQSKIIYYEKGVDLTNNPRYLEKLIFVYYNTYFNKDFSVQEKKYYGQKANILSKEFLQKYPFNKQISIIYHYTQS